MANWTQEGSAYLLGLLAKGGTVLADSLWVGLATAAPTATSTLATLSEVPTSGGYARKKYLSADCTISAAGVLSAIAKQFGPGITVTGATHWFLCTSADNSGKLICWNALSQVRTLGISDAMTETITDIHIQ